VNPRLHVHSIVLLALAGIATAACKSKDGKNDPAGAASGSLPDASTPNVEAGLAPLPRTTDGRIAIDNLDGAIGGQETRVNAHPGDFVLRAGLVDLLLTRGQYLGAIADYERASDIAEALVRDAPQRAESWRARASTNATWHRFDAALEDLRAAEKAGAKPATLARTRSSILAATGKLDEAWAIAPSDGDAAGESMALAGRALIEGELGRVADAEGDLAAARSRYADVSPLPLAWMDAMQAGLYEKNGDRTKARAHYTRAVRILPLYAKAAAHLATYETAARAVAILEPVAVRSDDPEVHAELGDALRRGGRSAESPAELAKARAQFEALLVKHREAFADHAARFWMGAGADPPRALPLAAENAKLRPTDEAHSLWLEAAQAARDAQATCDAARALSTLRHATETLRAPARAALVRCPPDRDR
jgi:tetratricopeptide (TPR) repeat protein